MDKKLFKQLILLITFSVVLVAFLVKLDAVGSWVSRMLGAFAPLFIGIAIAFVLHRPCNFFARIYEAHLPGRGKRAARGLAVATSYVILLAVIAVLIALVVPEIIKSLENFVSNMNTYGSNFQGLIDFVVEEFQLDALADLNFTGAIDDLNSVLSQLLEVLRDALPHLISATSVVVQGVITGVLAVVFSVYMLYGAPERLLQCRRLAVTYLPRRVRDPFLSVVRLTADTFTRYVTGQVTEACILGCLCFVGMCIFRFDYAPLISIIIGVSALIPVAGAYIGAIVAVVLLVLIDPIQALLFLIFLVVLQQLEGNLIYPKVVGTSIGLPGVWVLAAVTVGSVLMGFLGLVISVPITAVIYTLLQRDLRARAAGKKKTVSQLAEPSDGEDSPGEQGKKE